MVEGHIAHTGDGMQLSVRLIQEEDHPNSMISLRWGNARVCNRAYPQRACMRSGITLPGPIFPASDMLVNQARMVGLVCAFCMENEPNRSHYLKTRTQPEPIWRPRVFASKAVVLMPIDRRLLPLPLGIDVCKTKRNS
jgi:hypothetical protein